MKKNKHRHIRIMTAAIIVMMVLFAYMLQLVNSIQGNARVINYTGMVRGATQRLVKNELYGMKDDEEIHRLDEILLGLKTGEGDFQIKALDNTLFQDRLSHLMVNWDELKELIYDARQDSSRRNELLEESEIYFYLADDTVSAAEKYASDLTLKLKYLEVLMIINILLLLSSLLTQITEEVRENRRLNSYAFTDPNTGLPNKRSCEMRLNKKPDSENVCFFMFDLNSLKAVNDSLGHAAGDLLIISFAEVLRRSAPAQMFVGRLGGDEFIGICEDMTPIEISEFFDRLETSTDHLNSTERRAKIALSFASGYATSMDHPHLSNRELMASADKDMYEKKAAFKKSEARTFI